MALRSSWRAVLLVLAATFTLQFAYYAQHTLFHAYATAYYSESFFLSGTSAYFFGYLAAGAFFSAAPMKKIVVILAPAFGALAVFVQFSSDMYPLVLSSRFALGAAGATIIIWNETALHSVAGQKNRIPIMAAYSGAYFTAASLSVFVIKLLAPLIGFRTEFAAMMWILIALPLLGLMNALRRDRTSPQPSGQRLEKAQEISPLKLISLYYVSFASGASWVFVSNLLPFMTSPTIPNPIPPEGALAYLGAGALAGLLFLAAPLKLSGTRKGALFFGSLGVGVLLYFLFPAQNAVKAFSLFIMGFSAYPMYALVSAILNASLSDSARSAFNSALSLSFGLGLAVGPILTAYLTTHLPTTGILVYAFVIATPPIFLILLTPSNE